MGLCLSVGHGHHDHGQYVTDDEEDGFCTPECVSSQGESHNPSGRYSFEFPTPPRISADVGDLGALGSLFYKRGSRSRSRDSNNNNNAMVSNYINTLDMFLEGANARSRVHHVNQLCTGDYSFDSYLASPLLKGFDVHAMEAVAKSYAESAAKAAARDAFVFLEENDISMVSTSSSGYNDAERGGCNVTTSSAARGEEDSGDVDDNLAKSVGGSEEWELPKRPKKADKLWVKPKPNEEAIGEPFNIFNNSKWEEPTPRKVENLRVDESRNEEAIGEITDKFTTSKCDKSRKVVQNQHEEAIAETTDKFTTSRWEEPKKPRKVEDLWVQQNQHIEEAIDKTINKFNNNKSSSNFSFWVSNNNKEERGTNDRWISVLNSIQARAKARRRQRRKSSLAKAHGAGTPSDRIQRCGSGGKVYSGGTPERIQRCGSGGRAHGAGALERIQRCGSIGKAPGAGAPEILQILQRWGSIGKAHTAGAPEIIQRLQRWGSIGKAHGAGTPERVPRCGSGKAHGGGASERIQRCGSSGRKKTVRFSSDTRCPPNSPAELQAPSPPVLEDHPPTLEDFSAIGRGVWEKVKHSPSLTKLEYKKLCELSSELLKEADMLSVGRGTGREVPGRELS